MLCLKILALVFVILSLKTNQSSAVLKVEGNLHISDAMAEFLKMKVLMDGFQHYKELKAEKFSEKDLTPKNTRKPKTTPKTTSKKKSARHRHEGHTKAFNNVDV